MKVHTKSMRNAVVEEDLEYIAAADLPWFGFDGKTVLITGAAGFLPAYMVETLLHLNEHSGRRRSTRVLALVRDEVKAAKRFAIYRDRSDLELIVGDVCRPPKVSGRVDYVIHAASQASPKFYGVDPVGTLAANTIGTGNMLDLAKEKGAEGLLFFSSGEVYGEVAPALVPTREDVCGCVDPTSVRACYAESKRMGETMCVAWHHQHGVKAKIVRPFHTYGPGMSLDDGRVYADFVADILAGRDIMMNSDGSARRAFCYLADAVAGFFTVLLKGADAQAYNIGSEEGEMSIAGLAEMLVAMFPEKNLKVRRRFGADGGYIASPISRNCPDTTKARALGWRPSTSVAAGFDRTIRSFA